MLRLICALLISNFGAHGISVCDKFNCDNIGKLLSEVAFLGTLPKLVTGCLENKQNHSVYEHGDCKIAEYLLQVYEISKKARIPNPLLISDEINVTLVNDSFQKLFLDFILMKRPFKTSYKSDVEIEAAVIDCAIKSNSVENILTVDRTLSPCDHLNFSIPSVLYNNYLPRVLNSSIPYNTSLYTNDKYKSIDYISHWPSIGSTSNSTSTRVHSCPSQLHLILWGTTQPLKIKLLNTYYVSSLEPTVHDTDGILPNHFKYIKTFQDLSTTLPVIEFTLNPNELAFIPNQYLTNIISSSEISELYYFKSCYLDASNFKAFLSSLAVEAIISKSSHNLLETLQLPSFPTTMFREVTERSVASMRTGSTSEGVTATVSEKPKQRGARGNTFRLWQDTNKWTRIISSLTMPQPPVPVTSNIGRNHIQIKWTSPYVPMSADTTRFGYNVSYCKSLPVTQEEDVDPTVCETVERLRTSMDELLDLDRTLSRGVETVVFVTKLTKLTPNTTYWYRIVMFYGSAYSTPSHWSSAYTTLPLTVPAPVMGHVTASTAGSTDVSLTFAMPSDDGGENILGYHIYCRGITQTWHWLGTGMYTIINETKHLLSIENLMPGFSYQFKVIPFNSIGSAAESVISNLVSTDLTTKDHIPVTIFGKGHPRNYLGTHSELRQHPMAAVFGTDSSVLINSTDTSNGTLLILLDVDKSRVTGSKFSPVEEGRQASPTSGLKVIRWATGWPCHWSAKRLQAYGQPVWANPVLADIPLKNAADLYGGIAIIQRGIIPIVYKIRAVQTAGAIGVIIVDDGRCTAFDQLCMPGADLSRGEKFAVRDVEDPWLTIRLPVILLLRSDAANLFHKIGLDSPTLVDVELEVELEVDVVETTEPLVEEAATEVVGPDIGISIDLVQSNEL